MKTEWKLPSLVNFSVSFNNTNTDVSILRKVRAVRAESDLIEALNLLEELLGSDLEKFEHNKIQSFLSKFRP